MHEKPTVAYKIFNDNDNSLVGELITDLDYRVVSISPSLLDGEKLGDLNYPGAGHKILRRWSGPYWRTEATFNKA